MGALILGSALSSPCPPPCYFPRNEQKTITRRRARACPPSSQGWRSPARSLPGRGTNGAASVQYRSERRPSPDTVSFLGTWQVARASCLGWRWGKGGVEARLPRALSLSPLISSFGQQTQSRVPAICSAHFINSKFILKTCRRAAICLHFCHSAIITVHLHCEALSLKPLGLEGEQPTTAFAPTGLPPPEPGT